MRDLRLSLIIAVLFSCAGLHAQDEKPSLFADDIARTHEIKPHRSSIPVSGVEPGFDQLRLTLTVSPAGKVVNADPHGQANSLKYWPAIETEVYRWHFAPFEKDGKPVTAIIDEYVDLVPHERFPKVHIDAPKINANSKIVITLERTRCYGTCPAYTVAIRDNGEVIFDGGFAVAAQGKHTAKVSPATVRQLANDFVAADFYSMDPVYQARVTDNPTYVLSISIDGKEKKVEDYVGPWVGMPSVITELEDKVDEVAQTKRWIKDSSKHE